MLSIRLWPGTMPSCDMQTFRSVGDTLALQTWSGENWCLGRESHRGNNVVHTQRHTPWPMHFWKQASSFLNILQYQTPLAEWLLNQSPHVWFWTRNPLLAEPSSNPHSHPQKPTQTSRLQHSALLKPSAQAINAMGAGASSTLKTASDADVKMHMNSLPKAMGNRVGFTWTWEFPLWYRTGKIAGKMLPKKNSMVIEFARKKVPS